MNDPGPNFLMNGNQQQSQSFTLFPGASIPRPTEVNYGTRQMAPQTIEQTMQQQTYFPQQQQQQAFFPQAPHQFVQQQSQQQQYYQQQIQQQQTQQQAAHTPPLQRQMAQQNPAYVNQYMQYALYYSQMNKMPQANLQSLQRMLLMQQLAANQKMQIPNPIVSVPKTSHSSKLVPPSKPEKIKKSKSEKKSRKKIPDSDDDAAFGEETQNLDEIPAQFIERRKSTRKTASVNYYDDEMEEDFIEEQPEEQGQRLDHIYLYRVNNGVTEYLVRFQDSQPAMCQWVNESHLNSVSNIAQHLPRFKAAPVDISELPNKPESSPPYPVAHRRKTPMDPYELLFRFTYEACTLFYWDGAPNDVLTKYGQSRERIFLQTPPQPSGPYPPPTAEVVVSSDGGLRPYQVDGLKWLISCWVQRHGSILADEMGLGKTIQVLAFLQYLSSNCWWRGPFLITVRTNCFKQWCDEIEKWTSLKYCAYNGGPAQRALMREYQFPSLDSEGNPVPNTLSFNILLVSYDVLLKDMEFLNKYTWEVIILDEGHRIKNGQGKKNNAISSLNAKQRIILTGTPVQNSIAELWALLKFVSPSQFSKEPSYLNMEIEKLPQETVRQLQQLIKPHLMRRSLSDVEHSIAPKEERVALIALSKVQNELMRLIKLHALWRLRGVQVNEETIDTAHEGNDMHKVCLHPFLVDGAEEFYASRLNLPRLQLLLAVSAKFQWLDRALAALKEGGHRVLIFSQSVKLLGLLKEYCTLKGYGHEMLIGQMGDVEKNTAVSRFADPNSSSFIFLISTRAGSEGLNLTVADTAIIFDPDWNPQNDLQAQARVHRIGQTQKVDIIRLITYCTYEHDMFVRAQRKLELWRTLLGGREIQIEEDLPALPAPPQISERGGPVLSFKEEMRATSTVIEEFTLSSINQLEKCLENPPEEPSDGLSNEAFLELFPIEAMDVDRRAKRSRSMSFAITAPEASNIYIQIAKHKYGEWADVAASSVDRTSYQVQRFSLAAIITTMRSLSPSQVFSFPLLLFALEGDVPEFGIDLVVNTHKHKIFSAFPPDHEMANDAESCRYLKDEIMENGFEVLTSVEFRMVASAWVQTYGDFNFDLLPPPHSLDYRAAYEALTTSGHRMDVFDLAIQNIVARMRFDLICSQQYGIIDLFPWWTGPEFAAVVAALRKVPLVPDNMMEFHAHTGLLGKCTQSVFAFASYVKRQLQERSKGAVTLSAHIARLNEAPHEIADSKTANSWLVIPSREAAEITDRMELISALMARLDEIPEDEQEPEHPTSSMFNVQGLRGFDTNFAVGSTQSSNDWKNSDTAAVLEEILKFGVDILPDILSEERFIGKEVPSNLRTIEGLHEFANISRVSKQKSVEVSQGTNRLRFVLPQAMRLRFTFGVDPSAAAKKKKKTKRDWDVESGDEFY